MCTPRALVISAGTINRLSVMLSDYRIVRSVIDELNYTVKGGGKGW